MGIGRLKPGITIEQARDEVARIGGALRREFPDENRRHGVGVAPAGAIPVSTCAGSSTALSPCYPGWSASYC